MQSTKSGLETIYEYTAATKEGTARAMKDALPAARDKPACTTIRNAVEKLEKLPEPGCSRFLAGNKAHRTEKSERPALRRPAAAKERVKQPALRGHGLPGIGRSQQDTQHMAILDVLNDGSPVGSKGERYRSFLPSAGYNNARASEERGGIKICSHAAVPAGKPYPDKKAGHGR